MSFFLKFLFLALILEGVLYAGIRALRKAFPWIITSQDELPIFNEKALKKFFDYSFDPELGWVRKPNTTGTERGRNGDIQFHIDASGSRSNSYTDYPPCIAAFGDSYTFCRQVEDDETWEAILSREKKLGVSNYGVGNYGVDQALLRYEQTNLPDSVKFVVMGFVPETICRIQSYWKHYLEFGNTFAFKPRFSLDENGQLKHHANLVRTISDFQYLEALLPDIRRHDRFYQSKFRKLQFRFPYALSLIRNPIRHIRLIAAIAIQLLLRTVKVKSAWAESLPFAMVMRENIRNAHRLYGDQKSTDLLEAILIRFSNSACVRGQIPLVVLMPQLMDLKLIRNEGHAPYADFFHSLRSKINVVDLTDKFLGQPFERLYVNDQYGGHLSYYGNTLVSQEVSAWIDEIVEKSISEGVK
jgi:hypothetical protein